MAAFDPAKRTMFPDVYENIDKIQFDVYVHESYTATMKIVENAWIPEGANQPIFEVNDFNAGDVCKSSLTSRYIVDAIVNGNYLRFAYTSDMFYVRSWLETYVKQCEHLNLENHPYAVFIKNCKRVLDLMNSNISEYNKAQEQRHPKPVSIVDLMSVL